MAGALPGEAAEARALVSGLFAERPAAAGCSPVFATGGVAVLGGPRLAAGDTWRAAAAGTAAVSKLGLLEDGLSFLAELSLLAAAELSFNGGLAAAVFNTWAAAVTAFGFVPPAAFDGRGATAGGVLAAVVLVVGGGGSPLPTALDIVFSIGRGSQKRNLGRGAQAPHTLCGR